METQVDSRPRVDIRRKGAVQAVLGLSGAVVLALVASAGNEWLHAEGLNLRWLRLIPALPAGYGLAGLMQWVSGRPFVEMANAWDELKGWQRGVIGMAVVIAFCALMFAAMMALAPTL